MSRARMNRRSFLKLSLATGAAPLIIPARSWGNQAPSRTLNLACIGLGNHGGQIARQVGGHGRVKVVAVCDVDLERGDVVGTLNRYPDARRFYDFRVMFDEMADDIDAVTVGTPDHAHFPIAMHAIKLGKHVYVEKPMANTFHECALLMAAAKQYGVVTQVGNYGFSGPNYDQHQTYAEAGLFAGVHTIIAYMNGHRRWHGWGNITAFPEGDPIPRNMRWDVWHTTAEERPFSRLYHPQNWRGWYRYGGGAMGDWAPHIIDTAHHFMKLGLPARVDLVHQKGHNPYIFPLASTIKYHFPEQAGRKAINLYWYEGPGNQPTPPPEFGAPDLGETKPYGPAGRFLIGGEYMFHGTSHARPLTVIPENRRREVQGDLPRHGRGVNHTASFVMAALGEGMCRSTIDIAGPFTQMCCLGAIAQELNTSLVFDPVVKRFTDNEQANALLEGPPPRKGWEHYYTV
jgi:predicted dehydrogenase